MANLPLSDLDWQDEVREKFAIDETTISNDMLERESVKGHAESEIKKVITDWAAISGDNAKWLRTAVIYRICILIIPTLRFSLPSTETIGTYKYSLSTIDWGLVAERFMEEYNNALMEITTYVVKSPKDMLATPVDTSTVETTWGVV